MIDTAYGDNVTRILDSAERLFRVYGYSKTNVADIAKDLGMSPANIYRFFRAKSDIHEALAVRMLESNESVSRAIAAMDLPATERLRRFLIEMHRMTVETMVEAEKVHEMVVIAMERQWGVIEAHIERQRGIVEEIIADGVKKGELPDQDPVLMSKCFFGGMAALVHPQCVAQCPARNNRATPEEMADFLIRGLLFTPPSSHTVSN